MLISEIIIADVLCLVSNGRLNIDSPYSAGTSPSCSYVTNYSWIPMGSVARGRQVERRQCTSTSSWILHYTYMLYAMFSLLAA